MNTGWNAEENTSSTKQCRRTTTQHRSSSHGIQPLLHACLISGRYCSLFSVGRNEDGRGRRVGGRVGGRWRMYGGGRGGGESWYKNLLRRARSYFYSFISVSTSGRSRSSSITWEKEVTRARTTAHGKIKVSTTTAAHVCIWRSRTNISFVLLLQPNEPNSRAMVVVEKTALRNELVEDPRPWKPRPSSARRRKKRKRRS